MGVISIRLSKFHYVEEAWKEGLKAAKTQQINYFIISIVILLSHIAKEIYCKLSKSIPNNSIRSFPTTYHREFQEWYT